MLRHVLSNLCLIAGATALTWIAASDTHLGHDVGPGANFTTSYTKNVWAITEMNSIPGESWPASLGGGVIAEPTGVTVSGDLLDGGVNPSTDYDGCAQWVNFTALYGLNGSDGLVRFRTYEGRGNHDGKNTSLAPPKGCEHSPSGWIVERNQARVADPAFSMTGVSNTTGLHYSWTWNISSTCALHFVHLNLFPGSKCGSSPSNPGGEGTPAPGFPCSNGDLAWPEDSQQFLESDLAAHAGPGVMVITLQHYGFDAFSNTWYNVEQREALWATLLQYNTLAVLVGHTHSAELYSFNGTAQGPWAGGRPGFIDVINAPATQKEDGQHNPLPSEFMLIEATLGADERNGTLRVAQRVGHGWGDVLGSKSFVC